MLQMPLIVGDLSETSHPKIYETVSDAICLLPIEIREVLTDYKVSVARRICDVAPEKTDNLVRGYEGLTSEYASALCSSYEKHIIVAQERKYTSGDDRFYTTTNLPYHTTLHEIGHAFDDMLGDGDKPFTEISRDFWLAFQKDIYNLLHTIDDIDAELKDGTINELSYYLFKTFSENAKQEIPAHAQSEVFAEAFAHIIGGIYSGNAERRSQKHLTIFRNCYAVVEQKISEIAPNAHLYPHIIRKDPLGISYRDIPSSPRQYLPSAAANDLLATIATVPENDNTARLLNSFKNRAVNSPTQKTRITSKGGLAGVFNAQSKQDAEISTPSFKKRTPF